MNSSSSKSKHSRNRTVAVNLPTAPKKPGKYDQGETIRIISSNLIRNIRIRRDPVETGKVQSAEYNRICSASCDKFTEANKALRETPSRIKEPVSFAAAREMKQKMMTMDASRPKRTPTKMELDAKTQAQIVMEKAKALKMEQEDEVKKLNRVITDVKCQAVRDYQMQEKKQIRAELSEEDARLDRMMETNRVKFLETEAKIEKLRKEKTVKHKQQILRDVQERLEVRQVQRMTQEIDRQHIQKQQEKIQQDQVEALKKKRKEQQRQQAEIMQHKVETEQRQAKKLEEDAVTALRITAFKQYRGDREAKVAADRRQSRLVREMATNRVGVMQQRANANRETQHQRFLRKLQENDDREWKKQQRELARGKVDAELRVRAARIEQIHCKGLIQSAEAGRQKAEFDKILKMQQDAVVRHEQAEERRRKEALQTAEVLQQQMKERKAMTMARFRESMDHAKELAEAEQQRLADLSECREKKLQELSVAGLPNRYWAEAKLKTKKVTAPPKPVCRFPPKPSKVGLPPFHDSDFYESRN